MDFNDEELGNRGEKNEDRDLNAGSDEHGDQHTVDLEPGFREEDSSMGFLEAIYGVIFEPRGTFGFIGRKKPLLWAFGLFAGVFLFNYLVNMAGLDAAKLSPFYRILPSFAALFFVIGIVLAFAAWFLNAAVINLMAQFFGGNGNGIGLFAAFAFAEIPLVITSILVFVVKSVGLSGVTTTLVELAGGVWTLVLQVLAVSEVQEIPVGRAVLVYLVPIAIIIGIVLLIGGLIMTILAPFLNNLPEALTPLL